MKDGSNLDIDKVEIVLLAENEYVKVYNFEVADWHTYFVSEFDVLVHNKCKVDPAPKRVENMSEFFETDFGSNIKGSVTKTKKQFQGQSVAKVTKNINKTLKKGDLFY